jgi:hypothetical protein
MSIELGQKIKTKHTILNMRKEKFINEKHKEASFFMAMALVVKTLIWQLNITLLKQRFTKCRLNVAQMTL